VTAVGALRKLVLAPSMDEVTFAGRGFAPSTSDGAAEQAAHLESIPQHVILGFEFGIELGEADTLLRLDMVNSEFRGFAYEGAAMAATIRDVMPGGGGDRLRRFLAGPAAPHILLSYIGVGFAMARLPRPLWKKILPDRAGLPLDPTLGWLVVDGYGFDRAYFDTDRWVGQQYVPPAYPWQEQPDYFHRAVDQGIGRALWFIHAAGPAAVAAAVERFAPARRADLWSGVGLAATYAGAGDIGVLKDLRTAAGAALPEVAQGAVFAAKARVYGGLTTAHTETATRVLCDLSAEDAAALGDRTSPPESEPGAPGQPRYEIWRRRIQDSFR
jgi:enediyne biosynthesis protein E2